MTPQSRVSAAGILVAHPSPSPSASEKRFPAKREVRYVRDGWGHLQTGAWRHVGMSQGGGESSRVTFTSTRASKLV